MSDLDWYGTIEELMEKIRARAENVLSVNIFVSTGMYGGGPAKLRVFNGACATVDICQERSMFIHHSHLQTLINNGFLQSLNVPIFVMPRETRYMPSDKIFPSLEVEGKTPEQAFKAVVDHNQELVRQLIRLNNELTDVKSEVEALKTELKRRAQ